MPNRVTTGTIQAQGRGDASGLAASGSTYRVIAPPGVDATTGALAKPENMLSNRADNSGCSYLWSGFAQRTHTHNALRCAGRYIPPQVGHESGGTTTGAQAGIGKLGSYLCWNRVYGVYMGRWTTPDPAASPWGNLWSYLDYKKYPPPDQNDIPLPPNSPPGQAPETLPAFDGSDPPVKGEAGAQSRLWKNSSWTTLNISLSRAFTVSWTYELSRFFSSDFKSLREIDATQETIIGERVANAIAGFRNAIDNIVNAGRIPSTNAFGRNLKDIMAGIIVQKTSSRNPCTKPCPFFDVQVLDYDFLWHTHTPALVIDFPVRSTIDIVFIPEFGVLVVNRTIAKRVSVSTTFTFSVRYTLSCSQ